MIQKNLAHVALHTNFDRTHLNHWVAEKVLGWQVEESGGYALRAVVDQPFDVFAKEVQSKLGLENLQLVKASDHVHTAALVTGSGMSLLDETACDCFLTGDIKYHDAMAAKSRGISLIDITHYHSERFFGTIAATELRPYPLDVIIVDPHDPFSTI